LKFIYTNRIESLHSRGNIIQTPYRRSLIILSIIFLKYIYSVLPVFAANIEPTSENLYPTMAKRDLLCLMLAYPEYIVGVHKDSEEKLYVVMKSGKKILYDDMKTKGLEQKLSNPDLQDMMEQIYPMTDISNLLEEDCDPGRIRVYSLLREVYGSSRESIQSNLINVKAGGRNFQFNKNNKAAESLSVVMKEAVAMIKSSPRIAGFIFPASGTFNYRSVAGTGRLSPHSFGIAIDLKSDKKDYWKWTPREAGQKRLDVYPRELVQVFEKYNFIWGGKWGHFDILHFEYRPELTIKGRFFSELPKEGEPWFDGIPCEDIKISECIDLIDSVCQSMWR
jgi:hypothetical protein